MSGLRMALAGIAFAAAVAAAPPDASVAGSVRACLTQEEVAAQLGGGEFPDGEDQAALLQTGPELIPFRCLTKGFPALEGTSYRLSCSLFTQPSGEHPDAPRLKGKVQFSGQTNDHGDPDPRGRFVEKQLSNGVNTQEICQFTTRKTLACIDGEDAAFTTDIKLDSLDPVTCVPGEITETVRGKLDGNPFVGTCKGTLAL